jgi:hypothetical protein
LQVKIQYTYISRINWDTYSKPKNCIAKWRQWFHNIINCTTKWRQLLHNIMDCITKWRRLHNKMASMIAQHNGLHNKMAIIMHNMPTPRLHTKYDCTSLSQCRCAIFSFESLYTTIDIYEPLVYLIWFVDYIYEYHSHRGNL